MALVAAGMTNREIAERLHLSSWTVKRHVANLLRKVGVARRVQLALWFLNIDPSPPPASR
jgi:DNA-binding NarL/FixJ family response regulator